jgi:predicted Zn-dependent protease with MMP-like domain
MNETQREWIDYIERYAKCSGESKTEICKKLLTIEIGKEYGLSENEMDQIANNMQT